MRSSTGSLDLTESHGSLNSVLSAKDKVAGVFRRKKKPKAGVSQAASTESLEIRRTVTAEVTRGYADGRPIEQTDGGDDSDEVYDEDGSDAET